MKCSRLNRPRQHTPHGLRRLSLGCACDVGIGVQGKPCGEVAQHPGHRFHIHPVLQGQGSEGVSQVVEPHLGQSCPFQHPVEHMQHTIRRDGPTAGRGKHPGAIAHFLSLFFQNAYRILCQGQGTVSVFGFQGCFHHFPVDAGDLPPYPEVPPFQINARTAGICGAERGRSRPLSFLLLFFRRLPAAP